MDSTDLGVIVPLSATQFIFLHKEVHSCSPWNPPATEREEQKTQLSLNKTYS